MKRIILILLSVLPLLVLAKGKQDSRLIVITIDAARGTDAFIRDIYETLEADRFYKGKTTYLVTCDHGRGFGNEWSNHGSSTKGSEATWLMLLGKGIDAKGETKECGPVYTKQIAVTIASILGIDFTPDDGAKLQPIGM